MKVLKYKLSSLFLIASQANSRILNRKHLPHTLNSKCIQVVRIQTIPPELVPELNCTPFLKDHPPSWSLDLTLTHPCLRESIKVYGLIIGPCLVGFAASHCWKGWWWWWFLAAMLFENVWWRQTNNHHNDTHGKICTNSRIFFSVILNVM